MEFKVGDKVKRINIDYREIAIGDIGTISRITETHLYFNEYYYGLKIINFELVSNVKEEKVDDDLELIINGDIITIIDNDKDCIDITKEQLKQIYQKVF